MIVERTLDDIARNQAEKAAWLAVAPYLLTEIEQQIATCNKAILLECSKIPGPDTSFLQDLAAEKRALNRLKARFNQRCTPPKPA